MGSLVVKRIYNMHLFEFAIAALCISYALDSQTGVNGKTCLNHCGSNCNKCHSMCDTHYNAIRTHGQYCSFDVGTSKVNSMHVSCQSDLYEPHTKYVGMVFWGHGGKPNRNDYQMG